jgi:two-component system sensor histidine kinase HydH
MPEDTTIPRAWFRIRIQDILLALMLGTLIVLAHDPSEKSLLIALAILQLIEGRVPFLDSTRGRAASILLQMAVGFLLIGITGGVNSPYYLVLVLPVLSTATYLGVVGTVLTSVVAIGTYLSFLLFVDWNQWVIDPEAMHVLAIRCLLPAIAAVLVNTLGAVVRSESARYKSTAEQLAIANQNLLDAEAAIRRSERLAALGQLSAGLAHELRNPLGSIKGSADLLARSAAREDPMSKELVQIINEEVDRTNLLVTRFLDFARPLEPRQEDVDITKVIDRAANHARVPIIRSYSPGVPPLAIDPALMEQVFINLLTNAAQASPADAPITVATRAFPEEAEIAVIDRGCGIPADKTETVFNPFVTTKQSGVGLGLAIVAKIVDGHGGRMAVDSQPGKGSTFRVYLPIKK